MRFGNSLSLYDRQIVQKSRFQEVRISKTWKLVSTYMKAATCTVLTDRRSAYRGRFIGWICVNFLLKNPSFILEYSARETDFYLSGVGRFVPNYQCNKRKVEGG